MANGPWGGTGQVEPYKCVITWMMGTTRAQTGFHLRNTTLGFRDAGEIATEVADFANTNFRTILATADQLAGVDVVNMTTGEGGSVSFNNTTGTVGVSDGALPSYVMCSVSMKGELRRRYGQGRMLWPVRPEGWTTADLLTGAGITAFNGVTANFLTRFVNVGLTDTLKAINVHGVLPPRAATANRPARPEIPATWYDVTNLRVNNVLSFLRSRKAGVGS